MTGRGRRGRDVARLMLTIAVVFDAFVAFLFVSAPPNMGPLRMGPPSLVEWLVPVAGMVANGIGLVWMIRIVRSTEDAEAHRSFFRFNRS